MKRLEKKKAAFPLWLILPAVLFAALVLGVWLLGRDPTPQTAVGLVTAQQAAVYSEADEAATTDYAIPQNVAVTVLEQKDGWYYICIGREVGHYGWLKAADMTLPGKIAGSGIMGSVNNTGTLLGSVEAMTQTDAPPADTVRLYAGPGSLYGTVGKAALGTPAKVLGYEDGWFHITIANDSIEGYVPADALLLDTTPLILTQEETSPEDGQQSSTDDGKKDEQSSTDDGKKDEQSSTDDGKKDEQSSTDDGKKDEQSSTDDGKKDEQSSTDDGKKDEQSSTDDGKKDEQSSTDDGKKDEQSSTDDGKKDEQSKPEEEKKPPVALPASDTSVLAAGVISDTGVRLRKGAGTDTSILAEMNKGVPVAVLGWKDGWYKVAYAGKTGYVADHLLKVYPTTDSLKGYAIVDTDALNMRSKASTDGKIVKVVEQDDVLTLQGFENGWFKVKYDDKTGYVSGDYVVLRLTKPAEPAPDNGGSGSTGGSTGTGSTPVVPEGSGIGAEIAAYAQTFIGVPYVYGGTTPSGFDCSGFIQYVYAHFGYKLPRGTNGQYGCGTKVSKSDLQPGDLVFFNNGGNPTTHAGIYIGDGKFVHSTEYDYGTHVVDGVQIHPLSNAWYKGIYVGARRIVG